MGELPLTGLRVLDSADEKGELCGRLLADLGAQVVRVEPPGGSLSRRLPPFAPDGETSLYFAVRNAGKRGIVLDLAKEKDRERLHGLLAGSDIWIESQAPGTLAEFDLAPAALLERHPHLVLTSISDFGQTGPYRDYRGTDMIGFAMGGLMHRAGIADKPPLVAPGALAYDTAGVTAGFATLMATWQRMHSGRGQHVDVSVHESVANLSDWALPNFTAGNSGQVGKRAGAGIYTLYRCADGFVRMIILVQRHWRALLDWMGNPEELKDPALDQFIGRLVQRDLINPVVEKFFRDQKKIGIAEEAQRRGIPATPLLEPSEVLENAHTSARKTFCSIEVAPGLVAEMPSGIYELDGKRAGPVSGPPAFGEHDAHPFESSPAETGSQRSPAPAAPGEVARPLAGLRVLDFGVGAVGVEVGRLLAEYGADVIKIENSRSPDFIRVILSSWMNPSFASSSRSKRSFGVDLKCEEGRAILRRLAEISDVAIENSATGVMDRLGVGYEALRSWNPRLVMFSSQMVGSSGPWGHWIGYGPSTHPVSGLQYLWNYPEDADRPAGSTNVYPDHLVGRVGALGVVASLIGRERSGRGLHVESAQFETAIQLLGDLFAVESLAPGSVLPLGNASSRGAPWGAYPCAGEDEWCAINVQSDEQWRSLCKVLEDPEWTRGDAVASASRRMEAREEIDAQISAWTRERSPREVMETLQAGGVPAGILEHAEHHMLDPHLLARGYHRPVDQPDLGTLIFEGPAFRGELLGEPDVRPAPLLGGHTREICGELLSMSSGEVDDLIARGVLEDGPPRD